MFPIINLGPLSLPTSPVLLLAGFWLGSTLAEKNASSFKVNPEDVDKILWWALLSGLIGARLSYILRNPAAFQGQLGSILSINPNLLDPAGGILISLAISYYLITKLGISLLQILDVLVLFFSIMIPAVHLARFASGTGYGTFTDLPWGIDLWGGRRHPVQLYYALASSLVFAYVFFKALHQHRKPGSLFLLMIILTSGYLTLFSAFQAPGSYIIAGFRINQILSWLLFSLSLLIYHRYSQDSHGKNVEI
jgi:phosphatidylglycerol:prolipoprotein diacylglycerol transferase